MSMFHMALARTLMPCAVRLRAGISNTGKHILEFVSNSNSSVARLRKRMRRQRTELATGCCFIGHSVDEIGAPGELRGRSTLCESRADLVSQYRRIC